MILPFSNEVHHSICNKVCPSSSLYLKIKCIFSHYKPVLPARPKISMDFISVPTLRAGGVEAVRGMEEESWKELGSPPLVHTIKENKYLSLTCDSSSLSMSKICTTQRTVSLSATNPPNFHCRRFMLVLGRDAACQILFPQVPHKVSCKAFDMTCKKIKGTQISGI